MVSCTRYLHSILAGGRFPAGVDARYPRKSVYPGVLDFYRELDLGANGPSEWPHGQVRTSGGVRGGRGCREMNVFLFVLEGVLAARVKVWTEVPCVLDVREWLFLFGGTRV